MNIAIDSTSNFKTLRSMNEYKLYLRRLLAFIVEFKTHIVEINGEMNYWKEFVH